MTPKTILVVDDDPQFRELVTSIVAAQGHRVLEAGSAPEAVAIAAAAPLELTIVDVFLPGEEPGAAIARIRDAAPAVPMVCVSAAWGDYGILARGGVDDGVRLVLHKPINPAVFGAQIADLLRKGATGPHARVEATLESQLAALRREYGEQLPALITELAGVVRSLHAGSEGANAVAHARNLAHRLHGTAGSYGYPEVGRAAARVEALLDAMLEGRVPDGGALEAALESLALASGVEAAAQGVRGAAATRIEGPKLMVVDDDPALCVFVASVAERFLVSTRSAASGEEALAIAEAFRPDAVIVDVWLAASERGTDLASALRRIPGLEAVPIAFVSRDDSAATRVAAARAGGALYLSKPLDSASLTSALEVLLRDQIAPPATVLVVEKSAEFCARLEACIEADGTKVVTLHDPRLIFGYLGEVEPAALVLQGFLPWVSGFDACRALRAAPRWQDLPVILVTHRDDAELRKAAFDAGADDYIPMDAIADELAPRLSARIRRAHRARERSDRDALTGLLLRGAFMDALKRRLLEAARDKGFVSVAVLDVDHFKQLNDRHGHPTGDRVLASVAHALRSAVRASDIVGRWGGDELVLALPGDAPAAAFAAIERALAAFAALRIVGATGTLLQVTVSGGVAVYPTEGIDADAILGAADRRLYEAKRRGRARVVFPE